MINKSVSFTFVYECNNWNISKCCCFRELCYSGVRWLVFLEKYVKPYLNVTLQVKSQTLQSNQSNYNEYQEFLYDTCKKLHDSGLGYRKISYYLQERNILSVKGKVLKNNHDHSIIKKGTIRLNRINNLKSHKDYNIRVKSVMITHEDLDIEKYK